jgi:hypothetical protein
MYDRRIPPFQKFVYHRQVAVNITFGIAFTLDGIGSDSMLDKLPIYKIDIVCL